MDRYTRPNTHNNGNKNMADMMNGAWQTGGNRFGGAPGVQQHQQQYNPHMNTRGQHAPPPMPPQAQYGQVPHRNNEAQAQAQHRNSKGSRRDDTDISLRDSSNFVQREMERHQPQSRTGRRKGGKKKDAEQPGTEQNGKNREEDEGETSRSEARQLQFNKTKLCKFYIMGICTKNDQCQFAHDKQEMRSLPNLGCTKLCKTLIEKGVCRNANCTYAHSKDELRATSAFLKTKLCKFYMKSSSRVGGRGTCALGTACRYAHSEAELRENLDAQERMQQELSHAEQHAHSSSVESPASKHTHKSRTQSQYSGPATPTHINLDSQVPLSPPPQRPMAVQKGQHKGRANWSSSSAGGPHDDSRAGTGEQSNSDLLSGLLRSIDHSRRNSNPSYIGSDRPGHRRSTQSRTSSSGKATDEHADHEEVEDDVYDVWRQQMPLPLSQMTNRGMGGLLSSTIPPNSFGSMDSLLPSKPTVGMLRKNTVTANSFASLEVLAEDEPAFVALSECEEDGCKVERASIVGCDAGEQTVTEQNDASWVVKNTFLEFRDDEETRTNTFPLRNVRSAFACLSSLDNFNAV